MKNFPEAFTNRMRLSLGEETYPEFIKYLEAIAPTSIRINPKKFTGLPNLEKVEWCNTGYYLPERPLFVADPLWHAGAYYVQEASSMVLEQAFLEIKKRQTGSLKVLDLCAAPGGKSTHIASLLSDEDVLVSNEVIKSRVGPLHENLVKWGYSNTIITNSDSKDFEKCPELFDVVVVDAPCSGEGLFRKDENATKEWSIENAAHCALRQTRILEQVVSTLKPEGYLLYSTCTYNPDENKLQVDQLLKNGFLEIDFNFNGKTHYMHQCYPHEIKGEGFFIALMQKKDRTDNLAESGKTVRLKAVKDDSPIRNFINADRQFHEFRNHIVALTDETRLMYESLASTINCFAIGTSVCEKNDKLLIPSGYLPFSEHFNPDAFEVVTLSCNEALSFLGKHAIPHHSEKKGYAVLKYNGTCLGFGKLAGNRINNLFPNEWRLRRSIKAEEYFSLGNFVQ